MNFTGSLPRGSSWCVPKYCGIHERKPGMGESGLITFPDGKFLVSDGIKIVHHYGYNGYTGSTPEEKTETWYQIDERIFKKEDAIAYLTRLGLDETYLEEIPWLTRR